jgi:hypothetical protein
MTYLGRLGREGIVGFAGLVLMAALAGCSDGGEQSANGGAGGAAPAAPSSLTIQWRQSPSDQTQLWPEVEHNCVARDTSFADPAIRLGTLVERFGDNGVLRSICADALSPALQQVASRLGTRMTAR